MRKILSLLLVLAMVFSCIPAVSAAETDSVTVYLSVSKNNDFVTMSGNVMALYELTVPYFDLALYGLEDLYYNPDCYAGGSRETQTPGTAEIADGNVTMLHLFIYATEVIYNGLRTSKAGKGWLADEGKWNGFSVSTIFAGSSYCAFWNFGNDVNYYLNYEYPLGRENWGASCDQILLSDGDVVSVRYNANAGKDDGTYYHFGESGDLTINATQGEKVVLNLYETSADYSNGGITLHTPVTTAANIYATANSAPASHTGLTPVGATNSSGSFTLDTSSMSAGTYYITTNTHDPAVVVLNLEESEETSVLYGDLTGDGSINVFDAAMAYRIANAKQTATDAQKKAADVNGDGSVNVFDAALIYAYANGKRTSFPVEN